MVILHIDTGPLHMQSSVNRWYQMARGILALQIQHQLCQVDGTLHPDRGRNDAEGCAACREKGEEVSSRESFDEFCRDVFDQHVMRNL